MNKASISAVLVAVVIAIAAGWTLFSGGTQDSGGVANTTHTAGAYDAALGFKINGTTIFNSSKQLTLGTSGTAISGYVFGTCQVLAYSTTITASSTATVDCSSNGTNTGTISGLTANQLVDAWSTTTMSSLSQGLSILSSNASSTAGFITLKIANGTGATFTWTGAASTSIAFQAIR